MARYHINKNGVPAVCHAEKGNCPLGGVTGSENHYNSLEEAQAAVDNMHANDFISSSELEEVKQNGLVIKYIDNPSEQVQLEAIKQDASAIQYIKNPSEQVQLEAAKQIAGGY